MLPTDPQPANPNAQMQAAALLAGDPNAGAAPPAPEAAPTMAPAMPSSPPTLPDASPQHIEMAAAATHHSRLARILDAVGGILGGGSTTVLKKDADGNVTVEHNPSTSGEKWGRVAQAALMGAAQGFNAPSGPGGMGKAAGAGLMSGLQAPQQREEQAQREAATDNDTAQKIQEFKANKAFNQQRIAMQQFQLQTLDENIKQTMINRANATEEWITANPSNQFLANFESEADLLKYEREHPGVVQKGHTNGEFHAEPTVLPNGKPGVALYAVDGDWMKRKNDQPIDYYDLEPGDSFDAPMKQVKKTIPAGAKTNGEISLFLEGKAKIIGEYQLKVQANRAKQTTAEAAVTRADAMGEVNKARINAYNAQAYKNGMQGRAAGALVASLPGGTPPAPGSYDPDFPPRSLFPVGTEGIANPDKQGNFKVPENTKKTAGLARNIVENTNALIPLVQQNPDIFGAGGGRMSTVQQMIGDPDPIIQRVGTRIHNIAMATVGIHGSRAVGNVHDVEANLLNKYRNGADAVLGTLKDNMDSAQTFINEERNYQLYGTGSGPNRALAKKPAGAAPAGEAPPATLVPQGHETSFKNHGGVWVNENGTVRKVRDN